MTVIIEPQGSYPVSGGKKWVVSEPTAQLDLNVSFDFAITTKPDHLSLEVVLPE